VTFNYYIIYKPYEVLTRFTPEGNKACLADYFKVPKDVYPVGRLDYDSEGLLLLTNDKALNSLLLQPRHAHEREYWVQVDGAVTSEAVQQLEKGVDINVDGQMYHTRRCQARILEEEPSLPPRFPPIRFRKTVPAPWISLTLREGKNRQVRKMTAAVGFPTLRLVRYRIEQLTIAGMKSGELKQLDRTTVYKGLRL
jgi:23S rRNA pseudouridine2457 synthase